MDNNWIPVSEKLPERDKNNPDFSEDILISYEGEVREGYFCFLNNYWIDTRSRKEVEPTHWMLKPEPPQSTI